MAGGKDSGKARRADFQNANGDAYYSYRLVGVVVHTGETLGSNIILLHW